MTTTCTTGPVSLDEIDIHSTDQYRNRGYPWQAWDVLRAEAPVFWYDRPDIEPFWAVTRYDDIHWVSSNDKLFVNSGPRLRLASIDDDRGMWERWFKRVDDRGWDPDEPMDLVFMDRPRHTRKLTILDEAHNFTRGPIGQALVNETSRDSRKHNHCAIFMSQLPQDLQISQVDNLIGMAMAGRTDGAEEQAATLRFLNLPVGHGYERTLSGLSRGDAKGQFMVYDGSNVEVIQVDLAGCSEALRHALDSTPTGRPPARFPATPSAAAATMPYLTGEAAS